MAQRALAARHHRAATEVSRGGLPRATIALAVLDGFVGLTAAAGAVFVVPTLPDDLYRFHYFYGPTAPTVGLALVAVVSFTAVYGLLTRRRFAAASSIAAGAALALFELVESFAVGSVITPPAGISAAGFTALWLQPFYIAVGVAMVLLGGRAAGSRTNRPAASVLGFTRFPARATSVTLVALTVCAGSLYGWAAASTGTSMWARFIAWGDGTTYDWARFPSRPLPAAASPAFFAQAPLQVDLTGATGNSNPARFFTSSETTALLVIQHDKLVLER